MHEQYSFFYAVHVGYVEMKAVRPKNARANVVVVVVSVLLALIRKGFNFQPNCISG